MNSKLTRLDVLITALGLVGMVVFFAMYDRALPSIALDLKLSRAEIEQRAWETMKAYGYDLDGYQFALSFSSGGTAANYIERTLGIAEANRRIQAEHLPVGSWYARWFRPMQQEEFSLSLAPDGQVVGLFHTIQENTPGASLTEAQARTQAQAYLTKQQGLELSDWEEISASSSDEPGGRTDHYFEWKRRGFSLGESELRMNVTIRGERWDGYSYWLKVPEDFTRTLQVNSNKAGLVDSLATLLSSGFEWAAMAALLLSFMRHRRIGKVALIFALILGGVSLIYWINNLPLIKIGYNTTEVYGQFWFEALFYRALDLFETILSTFILWAAYDQLAHLAWPQQDRVLPRDGNRWTNLARSAWRGLMLFGIDGGFIVLFYWIVTTYLGAWSPSPVDSSSAYATPLPAIGPIASGIFPAISEEGIFRLSGTACLLLLTRKRWIAVLIPAVLFAFVHTSYVRDPYYLRGLEILIPAILFGLFFLKYGLATTIIAHMTFNATQGMLPMLRSGEPYLTLNGLLVGLVLLVPLLAGLFFTWRARGKAAPALSIQPGLPSNDLDLTALPDEIDWQARLADPNGVTWVLKAGEAIVGAATGYRTGSGEPGVLEYVYVAPAYQEKYWGSRLAKAVITSLQEYGSSPVTAVAPASNRAAISFMANLGFPIQQQVYTCIPQPTLRSALRDYLALLPIPERFLRRTA